MKKSKTKITKMRELYSKNKKLSKKDWFDIVKPNKDSKLKKVNWIFIIILFTILLILIHKISVG